MRLRPEALRFGRWSVQRHQISSPYEHLPTTADAGKVWPVHIIRRPGTPGACTLDTRASALRGSSSSSRWWLPLVGLIAAVLCMPFFRTVYGMGDEGVLLNGAERMLRGSRTLR